MTSEKHRGNQATDPGAAFARANEGLPPYGELVDVEWSSSGVTKSGLHKLGRRYVAAIIVGQSAGVAYYVASPETTDALGNDAATQVSVTPAASHTGTLRLWVF